MTIKEANEFRKKDKKIYELKNNKEFLKEFEQMIKNGYKPILSIDEMQNLIDFIVNWYEIKYPNIELDDYTHRTGNLDVNSLAPYMDTNQLLSRLNDRMISLMKTYYRGGCCRLKTIKDEYGRIEDEYAVLGFNISLNELKNIFINVCNGRVEYDKEIYDIFNSSDIFVHDLCSLNTSEYNLKEVNRCINLHSSDVYLRHKIILFAHTKMLYSKNTNPSIGIKRANLFLKEIKEDLNISYNDEIVYNAIADFMEKEIVKKDNTPIVVENINLKKVRK